MMWKQGRCVCFKGPVGVVFHVTSNAHGRLEGYYISGFQKIAVLCNTKELKTYNVIGTPHLVPEKHEVFHETDSRVTRYLKEEAPWYEEMMLDITNQAIMNSGEYDADDIT